VVFFIIYQYAPPHYYLSPYRENPAPSFCFTFSHLFF